MRGFMETTKERDGGFFFVSYFLRPYFIFSVSWLFIPVYALDQTRRKDSVSLSIQHIRFLSVNTIIMSLRKGQIEDKRGKEKEREREKIKSPFPIP